MAKSNKNEYFLGRQFDQEENKQTDIPFYFDADNLTTHAIVTGMTGSGKTGLCITMLEEAALHGVPAIIIDPKGDLTNLLLHFPDLEPGDFEPWLDADAARRDEKDLSELAFETAARWKEGLASWGLGREQLLALQNAARFTVYTPGSEAGEPVNILASFEAPGVTWQENSEALREKIASSVTALLGLVGLKDIDPLRSKEHILLSNIIEDAWSGGVSLTLSEIILRVQTPPFERLGAFTMEKFFPEDERMELALTLNNFLASPSFKTWLEGQTLDIATLLYPEDRKPGHSIFYLAHLSENERMFFVTLLFAAIESWMRTQSGTSGLRALVYFDEIMGYLPPTSNPPSRTIMLRMLKQARAFGVGLLLATQNPVDVDYKALSNAGTWLIGRLQTEQDKARLLDGLSSAGGKVDLKAVGEMIAGLQKREFLYHSVYRAEPMLFQTRWALNYLAGPLTRLQVQELEKLQPGTQETPADGKTAAEPVESVRKKAEKKPPVAGDSQYSTTRPAVAGDFPEAFLAARADAGEVLAAAHIDTTDSDAGELPLLYRPALFARAEIYYYSRTHQVEYTGSHTILLSHLEGQVVDWQENLLEKFSEDDMCDDAAATSRFSAIPAWLDDEKQLKAWQKDFVDWLYRSAILQIRANEHVKVYAHPGVSQQEFLKLCNEAAEELIEEEMKKNEASSEKKLATLTKKISRQQDEVEEQQDELNMRRMEELGTHGELLLSFLSKRRRSISSSLTKRRLTEKAKLELEQEENELEQLEAEYKEIEASKAAAEKEIRDRWAALVEDVGTVPLSPLKKNIQLRFFGVAWLPYYLVQDGKKKLELSAYLETN